MTADELDVPLRDRLDLSRADVIAALKLLPARPARTGPITADEARLLDAARFLEDPESYAQVSIDAIATMARIIKTAYAASEVAFELGVNEAQIEQRRRTRSLWAVDDDGSWVYPAVQFDVVDIDGRSALKVVRGLDQVLRALPNDVHPLAIAGFLSAPQQELVVDGRRRAIRDWLSTGGAIDPVLQIIDIGEWASR
jgi:hypothetical protein